jgi:cytochrome c5
MLCIVVGSVASACGGAGADGETLLQERCTECHALSPTTNAKKSAEEWERTVARMVGLGANLNDEEQMVLVEYLAQTYGP